MLRFLRNLAVGMAMASPSAAIAEGGLLSVPSGQVVLPYEMLWEDHLSEGAEGETWLVLRFLAPQIAQKTGDVSFEMAVLDLDELCASIGLPLVSITAGGVDQIIVTLLDQPLPRGESDQNVTKFMSAYRVDGEACIWE